MTESFYVAISAPRGEAWSKVADWRGSCGVGRESFQLAMHVVTPLAASGEQAAGPVLCATTTVWLPEIPPQRVFDYICDGKHRGEWDMLAQGAPVQEDTCLATAQFPRGGVSVLRPTVKFCILASNILIASYFGDRANVDIYDHFSSNCRRLVIVVEPATRSSSCSRLAATRRAWWWRTLRLTRESLRK